MGQVGSKMRRIEGRTYKGLAHWCPACNEAHAFAIEGKNSSGACWTWDGDVEAPTFAPSMLIKTGPYPHQPNEQPRIDVCHYFLKKGIIEYLGDCTHHLKGQKINLPPLPEHLTDAFLARSK